MTRRALFASVSAPLFAQSKQEKGHKVLAGAMEALGGQKFLDMRDRTEFGRVYSYYNSQLRGLSKATIFTRYVTAPTAPDPSRVYQRERQSFGDKKNEEAWAVLFDEEKGWTITFRGAQPVPTQTLERYRDSTRRNLFYLLRQRFNEAGLIAEWQGSEVFENQPVDVVDITDAENVTVTAYIHQSTRLPLRQMFFRRDHLTRDRHEEVTYFSKYRDVGGGVQWPYSIMRQRDGEKVYEVFSETVVINRDLTDETFTLSAKIKLLPPAR